MKEISSLIDKILLIGITLLDEDGELIKQIQVFGPIVRVDANGIAIKRNGSDVDFVIPPDFDHIHEAQPGEYQLRTTGEVVINPDLLSSWTVNTASEASVEEYSTVGFGGYKRA